MRIVVLVVLWMLLCACTQEPTELSVPASAQSVERFPIFSGRAFQTQFTLHAAYPLTPALDYYQAHIGKPWSYCEWSGPEWQNFVDAQGDPPFAVHQQLHMWVNREAQREIMLSMWYESDKNANAPDSDVQNILLVEYMKSNVSDTIKRLKLRCTSGEGSAL